MVIEYKKGVTVIHTQGDGLGTINKNGYRGVTSFGDKFRVTVTIGHRKAKKYLIGTFDTIEEAAKARQIAEIKKYDGSLEAWLKSRPHGNSEEYQKFWKIEFERLMEYENSRRNY